MVNDNGRYHVWDEIIGDWAEVDELDRRVSAPPPAPTLKMGLVDASHGHVDPPREAVNLRQFGTGAMRDSDADATRYDLIPPQPMRRLAETYAEGARKYSDHNWLKGMPYSVTINHVLRHINLWLEGDSSEDHMAHATWGLFAIMTFDAVGDPMLDDRYVWR